METQIKIAVTGGLGYAGAYVTKALGDLMYTVTSIDLKSGVDFHEIQPSDFDVIIHFAAVSDNFSCDQDAVKALENNVIKLYEFIDRLNSKTLLIFASTAAVYGSNIQPNTESDVLNEGLSTYTQTKVIGEKFLEIAAAEGKRIVVLRLGTLYGHSPSMQYRTVVNGMTYSAEKSGLITSVNSRNFRAILSLEDLTSAILRIIGNPILGVFNLHTSNMSIGEIASNIQKVIPSARIEQLENTNRYSEFSFKMSNSKFIQTFGEFRVGTFPGTVLQIKEGLTNDIKK